MDKRVKKELGGPPAVTWLSTMGLCEGGGRKRDLSLRIKEMPVIPKTKESAKQKSQSDACFDRENGESIS